MKPRVSRSVSYSYFNLYVIQRALGVKPRVSRSDSKSYSIILCSSMHFTFGAASICYQSKDAIMVTRSKRSFRGKLQPPLKVYHKCKGIRSKAQTLIWHSLDNKGLSGELIEMG